MSDESELTPENDRSLVDHEPNATPSTNELPETNELRETNELPETNELRETNELHQTRTAERKIRPAYRILFWGLALLVCIAAVSVKMNHLYFPDKQEDPLTPLIKNLQIAYAEISTPIPPFDEVTIYPILGVKYSMLDIIETLRMASRGMSDMAIFEGVSKVKGLMYSIHLNTSIHEDPYRNAIQRITSTTGDILMKVPLFSLQLRGGHYCNALEHLKEMLWAIGDLQKVLKESSGPIEAIQLDIKAFLRASALLANSLSATNQQPELKSAQYFTRGKADPEASAKFVKLREVVVGVNSAALMLDRAFECSLIQMDCVSNYLRFKHLNISSIYQILLEKKEVATELESVKDIDICNQKIRFSEKQWEILQRANDATISDIQSLRKVNDPILRVIAVHGLAANRCHQFFHDEK
eukprot:TRINITY_DN212_c0_g1_i2.p1 TRINITY_DN212_c0_g1~~TRINITY_DN212_c0_g1_i2.p1  ORF type:complete len:420 (+),score=18.27 TRINITY_DN212_c0_g1_i2:23-1261(+)